MIVLFVFCVGIVKFIVESGDVFCVIIFVCWWGSIDCVIIVWFVLNDIMYSVIVKVLGLKGSMIIVLNGLFVIGIFGFMLLLLLIIKVCDVYVLFYMLLLVLF